MDPYEAKLVAHEALAAAMAGASSVGASLAGPIWGPFVELGSAAVTAGLAAHAVETTAGARGHSSGAVAPSRLRRAARDLAKQAEAPLAAYALDVACRVHARDPRALRHAAILVGACASQQAGSALGQLLFGWCAPLRAARSAVTAANAAATSARFVAQLHRAATEPVAREAVVIDGSPFASSCHSSTANDANDPSKNEVAA